MMIKILGSIGLIALAISSSVALADSVTPTSIGPDTAGAWQCTVVDNTQHAWLHEGPDQMTAQTWALTVCQNDSDTPHSCHLLAASCHLVDVHGMWRCFATDYKEHTRWQATREAPRWHAIHAAYQRCYNHSFRPETCYVNPAVCVHF